MSTRNPRKPRREPGDTLARPGAPDDTADATEPFRVTLLDVGPDEYGDAVLCQFGKKTILIDGAHPGDQNGKDGHPSIPAQLGQLLGKEPPFHVSLIVVTHAHQDHIGCLPQMVKDGTLTADWMIGIDPRLGWGRAEGEDRDAATDDERVRVLAAALREEVRTPSGTDDASLEEFLSDAVTLEDRYTQMLDTLEAAGTRVVRFGRDSTSALVAAFASVGLKIVGPSRDHVLECADIINQLSRDSITRAADAVGADAAAGTPSVYRRLVVPELDSPGESLDMQRPGPAINLQSVVTRFLYQGQRFLFAGDMQFEKTEVDNQLIANSVRRLRQKIAQEAPYALVKISHHGSFNAFSESILQELGETTLYGICAGQDSKSHPNAQVLKVLNQHRDELKWVRTDHNGMVTITFGDGEPGIKKARGKLNDAQPNTSDELVEGGEAPAAGSPLSPPPAVVSPASSPAAPAGGRTTTEQPAPAAAGEVGEVVEVHARIPHAATRVTITVEVQPGGGGDTAGPPRPPAIRAGTSDALNIAGGRKLPELLFVTNHDALAANIGRDECAPVLASLRARGLPVLDDLPRGTTDAVTAAALVRARLARHPSARGVVLLGGYDVVPALILDALPPQLRDRLAENDDPDNFFVWNDDIYGGQALPVSRVPDGKSARLVLAALQAGRRTRAERRSGVRNVARPFADLIYRQLPGAREMHVSKPSTFNQQPPPDLDADLIYFMLHGDYVDSSRFWGEGTQQNREAVNVSNVPDASGAVVFTGCCWGALTVDTPAGLVDPGRPFGQKTTGSSIALTFLAKGATAFVGCTGAHYSPNVPPYNFYGGPLHESFWRRHNAGTPPAEALFEAKREYAAGIPHGQPGLKSQAIENKILRQYTCLGLGW
jgi:beta-lactamase superfamily II metal-dependent hydrolase